MKLPFLLILILGLFPIHDAAAEDLPIRGFDTDWSRISIDPSEIRSGGPGKDGIPALTDPAFVQASEADAWLKDGSSMILVEHEGERRAYPLQILTWHEIVNDNINDLHISVTWCPLCNTAVVFNRVLEGEVLDFGTTGRLRFSNMLMYDRQSESWWQQAEGRGIMGRHDGVQLSLYPSLLLSWGEIKDIPGLQVLSRKTGYDRPYGRNPYPGYDRKGASPFLLDRSIRSRLDIPPEDLLDRVILVPPGDGREDENLLISYKELREKRLYQENDRLILWTPETASPLDGARTAAGRRIGSANAFIPRAGGRNLSFRAEGELFRDRETSSLWDGTGRALEGPLKGERLEPLPSIQHFWFSARLMAY